MPGGTPVLTSPTRRGSRYAASVADPSQVSGQERTGFHVGLPPGRYILVPEPGDPFPNASEQEVVVMTGVMNQILDPKEGDLSHHWVLGMGVYFR